MKLHGLVWIIVGAIVAGFSKFIQGLKPDAKMDIFFYVGLGFVAFGIFKLIVNYITSDKKHKKRKQDNQFVGSGDDLKTKAAKMLNNDLKNINVNQDVLRQKQEIERRIRMQNQQNQIGQQPSQNQNIQQRNQQSIHQGSQQQRVFCQRCGNPNLAQANFCTKCGMKLR